MMSPQVKEGRRQSGAAVGLLVFLCSTKLVLLRLRPLLHVHLLAFLLTPSALYPEFREIGK